MHLLSKVLVVLRKKKFFHFTYPLIKVTRPRIDLYITTQQSESVYFVPNVCSQ